MKASHAHLNITEGQWQTMLNDFRRVLNNYNVPEQEQKELFAIVESTKGDIVIPAGKQKGFSENSGGDESSFPRAYNVAP